MGGRESRTDRGWTSQDRDVCQAPRGLSSQGSGHAKRSQRNLETDGVRLPLSSSVQRSLFKATERGLPAPRAGRQVPSPLGLVYGASSRPRAAVMACHRMSQGTRVGRTLHSDPHNPQSCRPDSSAQCSPIWPGLQEPQVAGGSSSAQKGPVTSWGSQAASQTGFPANLRTRFLSWARHREDTGSRRFLHLPILSSLVAGSLGYIPKSSFLRHEVTFLHQAPGDSSRFFNSHVVLEETLVPSTHAENS